MASAESRNGASLIRAKTYAESTLSSIVLLIVTVTVLTESLSDAAISESTRAFK